jgi:hypothetical protein
MSKAKKIILALVAIVFVLLVLRLVGLWPAWAYHIELIVKAYIA